MPYPSIRRTPTRWTCVCGQLNFEEVGTSMAECEACGREHIMSGYTFQARCGTSTLDYDSAASAITQVETYGSGSVVKFRQERNLPNCLPEYVLKSLGMWTYEKGIWHQHYIFDGTGGVMGEDKPS
jgi:hypothetical protein